MQAESLATMFVGGIQESAKERREGKLHDFRKDPGPLSLTDLSKPPKYTRTPDKGYFKPGLAPEIKAWTATTRFRREMREKYRGNDLYIPGDIQYERKTFWKNELVYRAETNQFNQDGDDDNDEEEREGEQGVEVGDDDDGSGGGSAAQTTNDGSTRLTSLVIRQRVPLAPVISLQEFQRACQVLQGTDGFKCVLLTALNSRHNRFVDIVLQTGATSVNRWMDTRRRTMLHYAVLSTHLHRLEFLLGRGADVDAVDVDNQTALHLAVTPADLEHLLRQHAIYRALVHAGATLDVQDAHGDTVLHKAVDLGDFALIELLLTHRARISVLDNNGRMAFERASKRNAKRVLAAMVGKCARDEVERMWAHLLSRQVMRSVWNFHSRACQTCMRKMKECAALKVKNLRYWFYVHGNFRKEVKAIEDATKREAKLAVERQEAEAKKREEEHHVEGLISASEKEFMVAGF